MKPDFALLLSFEGIALLRRAAAYGEPEDGWYVLGTVSPGVPDLNAALAEVRARAVEIAPGGDPEVKLVLPTEQVKFLDIDMPGGDVSVAEAVEGALDGATPYSIDELVYDFQKDGDKLHIAAVARETLEEAESFAASNGFLGLGFVSDVAADAGFLREPFFGPTQQALTSLAPGVTVQGDESPIAILDSPPPSKAPAREKQPEAKPAEATPVAAPEKPAKVEDKPEEAPKEAPEVAEAKPAPTKAAETPKKPAAAAKPSEPDAPAAKAEKPAPGPKPVAAEDAPASAPADTPEPAKAADKVADKAKPTETAKPKDAPAKPEAKPAKPAGKSQGTPKPDPVAAKSAPEHAPGKKPAPAKKAPTQKAAAKPAPNPQQKPKPEPGKTPLKAGPAAAARSVPPAPKPLPADDAASDSVKAPGFASIRAKRDAPPPPRPGAALKARPDPAAPRAAATPPGPRDVESELASKARDSLTQRPPIAPIPAAPESAGAGTPDAAPGKGPDPAALAAATPDAGDGKAKTIGFASRRAAKKKQAKPPKTAKTSPLRPPRFGKGKGAATAAMASEAAMNEGDRMTVFGARGQQTVGGKPRFLGLILTTILLILLLAVAAVASIFLEDGLAGLFRRSSEAPIATAAAPDAIESTPIDPPLSEPAVAPEPVPETALALPETATAVDPEDPTAINVAALNAGVPAMSRDLVEDQIDGLSVPFEAEALTPEQAEARYAATGIWQRAPLPPEEPGQTPIGDVYVASIDPAVSVGDAVAIPTTRDADTDLAPPSQSNPYPPDAGLTFDENGLIVATPEGVRHPAGFLLVAGPPPIRPPLRPGTEVPTPAALPAEPPAESPAESPAEAAEPTADAEESPETPAPETELAGRAALPPPAQPEITPAPAESAAPAVVDTTLAGLRPRSRPADLEEQNERANLGGISLDELRQKRPRVRPDLPEAKTEAEKVVEASALAVAASVAPKRRPSNIQALVRQAERNTANQQQAAAATPAAVAPRKVTPRIPSSTTVAAAATQKNALNLRRVNLIGVYGKPSSRRALIRLSNGRYKKVKVGDRIDGGRVSAIGEGQLSYVKSGRNIVLRMPRG